MITRQCFGFYAAVNTAIAIMAFHCLPFLGSNAFPWRAFSSCILAGLHCSCWLGIFSPALTTSCVALLFMRCLVGLLDSFVFFRMGCIPACISCPETMRRNVIQLRIMRATFLTSMVVIHCILVNLFPMFTIPFSACRRYRRQGSLARCSRGIAGLPSLWRVQDSLAPRTHSQRCSQAFFFWGFGHGRHLLVEEKMCARLPLGLARRTYER